MKNIDKSKNVEKSIFIHVQNNLVIPSYENINKSKNLEINFDSC